jgi:hypothetical protein
VDEGAPDIWNKVMKNHSPEDMFHGLGEDEKSLFSAWKEKRCILMQKRVKEEVEEEIEADLSLIRESVPFIRVKVRSTEESLSSSSMCEEALLTIWQPTDEQLTLLQEGHAVEVQNLSVRQTLFDGLLQLTGNGRTRMTEYNLVKSVHARLQNYSRRRFLTMFEVHLLSHKILADDGAASCPWLDIDTVGAQMKVIQTSGNENDFCMHVSDEFNLLLRIECENGFLQSLSSREDAQQQSFPVFAFCDLRLLPFDFDKSCAVARFCGTSRLQKTESRIEELRSWLTTAEGHYRLRRVSVYLDAKLSLWRCSNRLSAVGYVVGLKCASSEKLHIEVDCGSARVEEWELPVCLLEEVLSIASQKQQVALLPAEEQRLAAFGVLRDFFRARGILWQFQLSAKPSTLTGVTTCNFVVSSISVADIHSLGRLYTS